jgi:hypothetical protein
MFCWSQDVESVLSSRATSHPKVQSRLCSPYRTNKDATTASNASVALDTPEIGMRCFIVKDKEITRMSCEFGCALGCEVLKKGEKCAIRNELG